MDSTSTTGTQSATASGLAGRAQLLNAAGWSGAPAERGQLEAGSTNEAGTAARGREQSEAASPAPFSAAARSAAYLQDYHNTQQRTAPSSPFDPAMTLPTPLLHHLPPNGHAHSYPPPPAFRHSYPTLDYSQGYKPPVYEPYNPFPHGGGLSYNYASQSSSLGGYPHSAPQSSAASSATSCLSTSFEPHQYHSHPAAVAGSSSRWPLASSPGPAYLSGNGHGLSSSAPPQTYQPHGLSPAWSSLQQHQQSSDFLPPPAPPAAVSPAPSDPFTHTHLPSKSKSKSKSTAPTSDDNDDYADDNDNDNDNDEDFEPKRPPKKRTKRSSASASAAAAAEAEERAEMGDDDYEDSELDAPRAVAAKSSSRSSSGGGGGGGGGGGSRGRGRRMSANGRPRAPPPRTWICHEEGCEKSFARPSALNSHMRTHSGDRPYICPRCTRPFSVVYNLQRHMKTHPEIDISNVRPADIPNLQVDQISAYPGDGSSEGDDDDGVVGLGDVADEDAGTVGARGGFGTSSEGEMDGLGNGGGSVKVEPQFALPMPPTEDVTGGGFPPLTLQGSSSYGSYAASSVGTYPPPQIPSPHLIGHVPSELTTYTPFLAPPSLLPTRSSPASSTAASVESSMFASPALTTLHPLTTISEQPSSTNASRPSSDDEAMALGSGSAGARGAGGNDELDFPQSRSPAPQPIKMRRLHQDGQHHYAPHETGMMLMGGGGGGGGSGSFENRHRQHLQQQQQQQQQHSQSQSHPDLYSSFGQLQHPHQHHPSAHLGTPIVPSPSLSDNFRLSFARQFSQSSSHTPSSQQQHQTQQHSPYSQSSLQLASSPVGSTGNMSLSYPSPSSANVTAPDSTTTAAATSVEGQQHALNGNGNGNGHGGDGKSPRALHPDARQQHQLQQQGGPGHGGVLQNWEELRRAPKGVVEEEGAENGGGGGGVAAVDQLG